MKYGLVIFDLDGTLLDTLDDLAAAVNHALGLRGFPPRSRDEVRTFIGNGVTNLIRRAVPQGTDEDTIRHALADFKDYYLSNVNVHTHPFEGILALLDGLKAAGIRAAVNSNKVDAATRALCAAQFGDRLDMALGEREGIPKKPAPDGVELILRELGIEKGRALYVGDGETDVMTAQNAGIDCAWVSWGYRRREDLGDLAIPHAFDTVKALQGYILS